jgi:UDPglucose 6-dehydrogenase
MSSISIIGTGHIGLVTAAGLAKMGKETLCMDIDKEHIRTLQQGKVPFYEPGLQELVTEGIGRKLISFTSDIGEAVARSQVIMICVGTPSNPDGSADLSMIEVVAHDIAAHLTGYRLIVEKSTVPMMSGERISHIIKMTNKNSVEFDVASVPEFLREGSAVQDFMHPDRVVIGVETQRAEEILRNIFAPFGGQLVVTDIRSAELIKHASNCFLAMKISYANALATICELAGADYAEVATGVGLDNRIGRAFLNAGVGYGGYCFPKDVAAFIKVAADVGYDFNLLKEVQNINQTQRIRFVDKLNESLWVLKGKTIAVLGLAFKGGTDDVRDSPAIGIIKILLERGAQVRAYDPAAMENAKEALKDIEYCTDPYQCARGADALAILTDWDDFRHLDIKRLKELLTQPIIIDGRNLYDPEMMKAMGIEYKGVGRGQP